MLTNMREAVFQLDTDTRWLFTTDGWEPERESGIESVCALVNGYCGLRAAVEEGSTVSNPATFVNGVFDAVHELVTQGATTSGYQVTAAPTPELVKAPDWSRIRVTVEGVSLGIENTQLLVHTRTLDMRRGVLVRGWRFRYEKRTTLLRSLRFLSLDARHLFGQVIEITPEDWSGEMTLEAIVDGDVTNEGGIRHLIDIQTRREQDWLLLSTRTSEKKYTLCFGAWARLTNDETTPIDGVQECGDRSLVHRWTFHVEPGQTYTCEKLTILFTSRDDPEPERCVLEQLNRAVDAGLPALLEASTGAWAARWATADVQVDGNATIQHQIRFALYHLIGCANPDDEHVSPGARALTGERYKGHVFWDTETFVFPFFVFTHPPTARALLMYRYHTLPAALKKAQAQGYEGALYAWESTDTGVDVTPQFVINAAGERLEILTGSQEHHISADIAYAIWQYWDATQDAEFLIHAGAEMLFEIARFWASRVVHEEDGHFHIRTVIGPDEYHEGVDDNAYTNGMARWALRRGLETVDWLRTHHHQHWDALSGKIGLNKEEVVQWSHVVDGLVSNFDNKTELFEQHRGYFELQPADLPNYGPRKQTMDVILGWDTLTKTQILKQADVVMLLILLRDEYPPSVWEANYRFYLPRTSHDSSLSAGVHALMAARLGDLTAAEYYFQKAANVDLDFEHGVTAAGGVHIAALGGMWQALVFGFGGCSLHDQEVKFEPHVPTHWGSMSIQLQWRGTASRQVLS